MYSENTKWLIFKQLRLAKTPLISLENPETSRLDMLNRCRNLLTELRRYPTADPHLLTLEARVQTLQQQADLSAADLHQILVQELQLAFSLFK